MRGKSKFEKIALMSDPKYQSTEVARFVNQVMRRGKKSTAQKIVWEAFEIIENKTKRPALEVFEKALENTMPVLEVRSRRIGGATYQVPMEVKKDRQITLAMRWLATAARDKQGQKMSKFLAQELMDAAENTGIAVQKKREMIKLAEINRAFAHYARM